MVSSFSRPTAAGQPRHPTTRLPSAASTRYHHKMISAAPLRLPTTQLCRNTTSALPRIKFLGDNLLILCTRRRPSHATVTGDNGINLPKIRLHPLRLAPTKNSNASRWKTLLPMTEEPGRSPPIQSPISSGAKMGLRLPRTRMAPPAPMVPLYTHPATDPTVGSEGVILLQMSPLATHHILSGGTPTTGSLPRSADLRRTSLLHLLRGTGPSLLDNSGLQRHLTPSTPHTAFIPSRGRATT